MPKREDTQEIIGSKNTHKNKVTVGKTHKKWKHDLASLTGPWERLNHNVTIPAIKRCTAAAAWGVKPQNKFPAMDQKVYLI